MDTVAAQAKRIAQMEVEAVRAEIVRLGLDSQVVHFQQKVAVAESIIRSVVKDASDLGRRNGRATSAISFCNEEIRRVLAKTMQMTVFLNEVMDSLAVYAAPADIEGHKAKDLITDIKGHILAWEAEEQVASSAFVEKWCELGEVFEDVAFTIAK